MPRSKDKELLRKVLNKRLLTMEARSRISTIRALVLEYQRLSPEVNTRYLNISLLNVLNINLGYKIKLITTEPNQKFPLSFYKTFENLLFSFLDWFFSELEKFLRVMQEAQEGTVKAVSVNCKCTSR